MELLAYSIFLADVVFSSAGWVSVNLRVGDSASFHAWSPAATNVHVRKTSILPFAAELYRGKRIKGTPSYAQKEPKSVKIERHFRLL